MEKLTWFERLLGIRPKRSFCAHRFVAMFTAETFIVDGYERCSGSATCHKCGHFTTVVVAANRDERDELLGDY